MEIKKKDPEKITQEDKDYFNKKNDKHLLPQSFFSIINPFNIKTKATLQGPKEDIEENRKSILENLLEKDWLNLITHLFPLYHPTEDIKHFLTDNTNEYSLNNSQLSINEIILKNNYQNLDKKNINMHLISTILHYLIQLGNASYLTIELETKKNKILIAHNKNADISYGFIKYKEIKTDESLNQTVYYISELATHINYQRKGVMQKLIQELKNKKKPIYLHAVKDPGGLIPNSHFYNKQKFTLYTTYEESLTNDLIKNLPEEESTRHKQYMQEYNFNLYLWEEGTIETIKYNEEIEEILNEKHPGDRTTYPIFDTQLEFDNEFFPKEIILNKNKIELIKAKNEDLQKILSKIKLVYNSDNIEAQYYACNNLTESNDQGQNILNNLKEDEKFEYIKMLCGLYAFGSSIRRIYFDKKNKDPNSCETDLIKNNCFNESKNITEFILRKIYEINKCIDSKIQYNIYYKKGDDFDIRLYKYTDDIIFYKQNDEIVAFISYNKIIDSKNKSCLKSIWIDLLATKITFQRKGIMKKLIDKLKNKNLPIALSSAHSSSKYASGPQFYKKNGFNPIDINTFLEYENDDTSIFYELAKSQKGLKDISFMQIYIWSPDKT